MLCLHKENELSDNELIDLMGFVNTIITHITNGNKHEERLVNIMGGLVIETESEKLIRKGKAQEIIEMGQEFGLDDADILKRLQEKTGLSLEVAVSYLEQYGKQLEFPVCTLCSALHGRPCCPYPRQMTGVELIIHPCQFYKIIFPHPQCFQKCFWYPDPL